MAMPRKLKNFNLYNEGESYLGLCTEINLPKLARKLEEYRGAGMNGPVKADLGGEALECEHSYGGFMPDIFSQYAIAKASGVMLRFAGAYQRDDTAEMDAIEVIMRGRHEEIDPGKGKAGDDTEFKVKTALTYLKYIRNGEVLLEIDNLNFIENVGGVDRLAEQRRAIGL